MTVKQLSVFVENKPGKLVEALETLSNADIDLRALSLADTSDFGILRAIADNPDKALEALTDAGFLVKSNEVLAVVIGDRPGGLAAIVRILSEACVNIEYTYAFIGPNVLTGSDQQPLNQSSQRNRDVAYVIIRVDDNEAAIQALTTCGVVLLNDKELYNM